MGSILSSPVKNQNTNHPPKEEEVEEGKDGNTTTNETNEGTTTDPNVDVKEESLHPTRTMVTNNDFIIRDGFPVLYRCVPTTTVSTSTTENNDNNSHKEEEPPQPNIDGIEEIPKQSFWSTLDDTPLLQVSTTTKDDELSLSSSLWWEQIQHDCHVVFDARTRCGSDEEPDTTNSTKKNQDDVVTTNDTEYSEGTTYFLPYEMKPRCTLEQIVQSILHTHTQHLHPTTFRPEQSGAEWWTLVLNQENNDSNKNGNDDDDDDEEDTDEVGLHFDADYGLEHQIRNMMIHPRLATVTYMSGSTTTTSSSNSILTPTIIYNIKSPNSLRNVADRDPKVAFTSSVQPVDTIWISYPQLGKHIAFDGRLLHGATTSVFSTLLKNHSSHNTQNNNNDKNNNDAEERPTKKHKTENEASTTSTAAKAKTNATNTTSKSPVQRITLMVNIWLNHCPLDAEPLEDDIIEQLITPFDASKNDDSNKLNYWNDTAVSSSSSSPVVDAAITNIDIASSSNNIAATIEEIILCNHNVSVTYDTALVDAFHKYTENTHTNASSTGSNLQINIKDTNMIQIHVHDEIPESDDDDDDDDDEN